MIEEIRRKLDYLRKSVDFSPLDRQTSEMLEFSDQKQTSHLMFFHKHRFVFGPPLTERAIQAIENTHMVRLPEEYRTFLMVIGNGGKTSEYAPGPGYHGYSLQLSLAKLEGELAAKFPYESAWKPNFTAYKSPVDYYTELENPEHVQGTLEVSDYGCSWFARLVIKGPERGNVWFDDRGSDAGLYPHTINNAGLERVSFLTWYDQWLDESIDLYERESKRLSNPDNWRINLRMFSPRPAVVQSTSPTKQTITARINQLLGLKNSQ